MVLSGTKKVYSRKFQILAENIPLVDKSDFGRKAPSFFVQFSPHRKNSNPVCVLDIICSDSNVTRCNVKNQKVPELTTAKYCSLN